MSRPALTKLKIIYISQALFEMYILGWMNVMILFINEYIIGLYYVCVLIPDVSKLYLPACQSIGKVCLHHFGATGSIFTLQELMLGVVASDVSGG